jgi:hypothetical protein
VVDKILANAFIKRYNSVGLFYGKEENTCIFHRRKREVTSAAVTIRPCVFLRHLMQQKAGQYNIVPGSQEKNGFIALHL